MISKRKSENLTLYKNKICEILLEQNLLQKSVFHSKRVEFQSQITYGDQH